MADNPEVVTVAATRADGGLTVSRFVLSQMEVGGFSDLSVWIDAIYGRRLDLISEGKKPSGDAIVSWVIVPNDYVDDDTDRTYRNAWKHTSGRGKPDHDMGKAKDIHREHLRHARSRPMDDLDIEYQRADERNDVSAKRDVATRKQKLRDVTSDPRIEAAQTVEELKLLTLEELTK